jgi:uroporphyrinogen decarboxylase
MKVTLLLFSIHDMRGERIEGMNSRERVVKALNHEEPDRVPKDLGATNVTGISIIAYDGLLRHLGLREEIEIIDPIQGLAKVSTSVKERLGIDTYGLWPRGTAKGIKKKGTNEYGENYFIDEWGYYWLKPRGGLYYDVVTSPLKNINPDNFNFDTYDWPDKNDSKRLEGLKEEAKQVRRGTDLAIVLMEALDFFLFCCWLRGFENFLTDLYLYPDFAHNLLEKVLDIQLRRVENSLNEVGEYIDVAGVIGDDWGTQDSLYVAPKIFDEFFRSGIVKMVATIRRYTDAPIFAHSCGAIREMIPDFINIGFNILNPVQVSARDMDDTADLKKRFGRDIVFWGGGIDTQGVLNHGSPDEVERDVKRRIKDLAPGGGFVFCPVHNIQADAPPENILQAYRTADQSGRYPITV